VLGLKTLGWIDRRLREIFPGNRNEIFRGLTVLLIGDFFQLPPVLNKLLYTTNVFLSLKQDELLGRNAYLSFGHSVFLTTIQRQAGDDQALFRKALLSCTRSGSPSSRESCCRPATPLGAGKLLRMRCASIIQRSVQP